MLMRCGLVVFLAVSPFFFLVEKGFAVSKAKVLIANNESKLNRVIEEQITNHQRSATSQKAVSAFAEESKDLTGEYEHVLHQIESARAYNQQLRALIEDQTSEMTSIRTQIKEVRQTGKEVMPLMLEMITSLKKFIELDVPFLKEERTKRLSEITKIMDRADVSVSEKYRRIMEAYQEEITYGKTLEAYRGFQMIDGKKWNVEYLRIGRLALIYQSLDGKKQAYWNQNKKEWVPLASRWRRAVETGLQVAYKRKPVQLLMVPVPGATPSQHKTNNPQSPKSPQDPPPLEAKQKGEGDDK